MEVDEGRWIRDWDHPQTYILSPNADNAPLFRGEGNVWPLVRSMFARPHFGAAGEIAKDARAEIVRIYETSASFGHTEWEENAAGKIRASWVDDLRREVPPLIVTPTGFRRILRIAWATSDPISMEPISVARAAELVGGRQEARAPRYPRLAPPGAPAQPIAFERRLTEYPCMRVRFLIVTWESPQGF